jgi:allophanate hydrolase
VPACRSLDCVSIFARSCAGARAVAEVATAFDAEDPYARPEADGFSWREAVPAPLRVGIPLPEDRRFFGDAAAEARFAAAEARLADLGAALVPVPMGPFFEAAALLYEGPFIAERLAGLEPFVGAQPEALLPVTRAILERGALPRGTEVFAALHRLEALKALARAVFRTIDALLVPTTPTIYRVDEILADPVRLNARLGTYTNFVNLLDLAAIAVPNGLRPDGLPSGVTFVGPWGSDARLAAIGALFTAEIRGEAPAEGAMELAVVGAHLSGEPLNGELVRLGARLVRAGRTAPRYRLFALPGTSPEKPGLLRVDAGGAPIEVEVWALPPAALGRFFAGVAAPLSIGRVELEDGARVAGFLCEAHATTGARDISSFGGWRAYRRAAAS